MGLQRGERGGGGAASGSTCENSPTRSTVLKVCAAIDASRTCRALAVVKSVQSQGFEG